MKRDMFKLILFDLDGTLTESHPGIIRSVQYALNKAGYPVPGEQELLPFVGPPLVDSFINFIHMTEEEARQSVVWYREYFSTKGKYENSVYAGIPDLLARLKDEGFLLGIASSKPEAFVRDILDYFSLTPFFAIICGSTMDGSLSKKPDIIRYALKQAGYLQECVTEPDQTEQCVTKKDSLDQERLRREVVMVGDRKYDVTGAHEMGMSAIGVTWGYGSPEELEASGADALADDPLELYRRLADQF